MFTKGVSGGSLVSIKGGRKEDTIFLEGEKERRGDKGQKEKEESRL